MQKDIIILGKSGSGKSRLATIIAGERAFMINSPSLSSRRSLTEQVERALSMSDTDPEVIIIDDVRPLLDIEEIIYMSAIGLLINRKGESPKTITPWIILVCDKRITPGSWISPTLTAYYDVICLGISDSAMKDGISTPGSAMIIIDDHHTYPDDTFHPSGKGLFVDCIHTLKSKP